jgi:hypothetical protein
MISTMTSLFSQLSVATKYKAQPVASAKLTAQKRAALAVAHAKHTSGAVQRYKDAMLGAGWLTTYQVECRLGYGRTVARDFLVKLVVELKLVERRPRNGEAVFNRKQGWEWRWVSEHN